MTEKTGGITGKGFVKGDPRINRKGRPRSFDALRELAQQVAHEEALSDGQPIIINGHKVTVAEAIVRKWAQSKDPRLQQAFIEICFGKVPQNVKISGADGNEINVRIFKAADD